MPSNDELRALNKRRRIHQIAWVTRDLEKSMRAWVENLGVGPWTVLTFTNETVRDFKIGGEPVTEPFEFLIAIAWLGDIQLELIEPVKGPMIYEDFLQRKGEGLHHIKEHVTDADMERVLAGYREKGMPVTQTGWFHNDVHHYLDTEPKLDFILELGNCPLLELDPKTVRVYPPE